VYGYSLHYKYKNENGKIVVQKSQKNGEKNSRNAQRSEKQRKAATVCLGDITKIKGSN